MELLGICLMKITQIISFLQGLNLSFDFKCYLLGDFRPCMLGVEFLNFNISSTLFVVYIIIDKYFTHIKVHFGGFLIKITQISTFPHPND